MIHAYIAKDAILEVNHATPKEVSGFLAWCMTKAGMEKDGGKITFDHVRADEEDSVLVVSSHIQYSPEDVLIEVMLDNDPRSGLLITQEQTLNA